MRFHYGTFTLRVLMMDNDVYFVGKDLAKIIGYKKERGAIQRHVSESNKRTHYVSDIHGTQQKTICISVSGALELIAKSKDNCAPSIRNWFNTMVLPIVMRYKKETEIHDEYDYWMTPIYTYKDIHKKINVNINVLTDFLMNYHFMDNKFRLMNKGIFIVNHRFTRIGYEFVKEMMKVEGFKK